jgi:hypothetical protein
MTKIKKKTPTKTAKLKFEAVNLDSIFPTLDAIAWLDFPNVKQIGQFAGIDPRSAGKILKNCSLIGVISTSDDDTYTLNRAYPYKGSEAQKRAVIKEALVRLPLMIHVRQFLSLGDNIDTALRKAATVDGITNFDPKYFTPLLKWAKNYDVLKPEVKVEDLIDEAETTKEERHKTDTKKVIAFISHSSKDKPFIRQLTADLTKAGISVWLDEQKILVGDSISEKISQGLVESDYFLIALSDDSVKSAWVQRELNAALINEIEKRQVKILPIKLSDCEVPTLIKDKKYADFSTSYKTGLDELLKAFKIL